MRLCFHTLVLISYFVLCTLDGNNYRTQQTQFSENRTSVFLQAIMSMWNHDADPADFLPINDRVEMFKVNNTKNSLPLKVDGT